MSTYTFRFTVAAVLAAAAAVAAHAQDEALPRFTSRADLVAVTVTVANHDGSFLDQLTPDDFQVFDNGERQRIAFFDHGRVAIDLAVLVDNSASMASILPAVRRAAGTLLDSLSPRDRASVITFGGTVRQLAALTSDRATLHDAIGQLTPGGSTMLYDALYVALKSRRTSDSGEVRRRAIVVLTDGEDTSSLSSYEAVMDLAKETDTAVYVVLLRVPDFPGSSARRKTNTEMRVDYEMRALASQTGGRAIAAEPGDKQHDALDRAYSSIAKELSHQYSLAYVPPQRATHAFAQISVVVPRADVSVRARRGYMTAARR